MVVEVILVLYLVLKCSFSERRFRISGTEFNVAVCLENDSFTMVIAVAVASLDNVRHVVRSIGRVDDCVPLGEQVRGRVTGSGNLVSKDIEVAVVVDGFFPSLRHVVVAKHRLLNIAQEENGGRLLAKHEKAGQEYGEKLLTAPLAVELLSEDELKRLANSDLLHLVVEVSIVAIIMAMAMTMPLVMSVVTSVLTVTTMAVAVATMTAMAMLVMPSVLVHVSDHLVEGLGEGLRLDLQHDEQLALLRVQLVHVDALVYGLIRDTQRQLDDKSVF